MPKNTASKISVDRQLKWYERHKRRDPTRCGILIEGDSWFTTPVLSWEGPTLVARLKRHEQDGKRRFAVVSVANPGATLVQMLGPNNVDFQLATNPDLLRKQTYDIVLLSAGGNDFLGDDLELYLNDASPGTAVRRCIDAATGPEEAARCAVRCGPLLDALDNRLATMLHDFRGSLLRPRGLGNARILAHGYDYPFPDGRPMEVLGFTIGPWLKPLFQRKRLPAFVHRPIVKLLVDEFNRMLGDVARARQRFHYLDLRGLLNEPADWADEIHPHSDTGIKKLRDVFVGAIHQVHTGSAPSVIGGGRISDSYRCR